MDNHTRFDGVGFYSMKRSGVKVGDLVLIQNREPFPADLVCLAVKVLSLSHFVFYDLVFLCDLLQNINALLELL